MSTFLQMRSLSIFAFANTKYWQSSLQKSDTRIALLHSLREQPRSPFSRNYGYSKKKRPGPGGVILTKGHKRSPTYNLHRFRRFGRLILTDRSVIHGRYRRRFDCTYGRTRSISTSVDYTWENSGRYRWSVRLIVSENRLTSTIQVD